MQCPDQCSRVCLLLKLLIASLGTGLPPVCAWGSECQQLESAAPIRGMRLWEEMLGVSRLLNLRLNVRDPFRRY